MKIGDIVKVNKDVKRYGGKKGTIKSFNGNEIGINIGETSAQVWFLASELEGTK